MVHPNSKKIKKVSRFGELVQQKTQRQSKIVNSRTDLLKEYRSRNNKNSLEDRRFLGKKPSQKFLGNIEKRQKKKLAFFNLDSDDEQQLNLTHKGINLDQIDDFKDNEMDRSFSEDENINADMVDNLHFGGFDEDEDKDEHGFQQRKKSKQEIYKELIHKSKKLKFQRQQQQFENEQKIEELDEDFGEIFHLLAKNPEQYKEEKRLKEKDDYYISLQNQLAFDKRIKLDGPNAQDPKKSKKAKKNQKDLEEEDSSSELGVDEEIRISSKKERKLRDEIKNNKKEKKFYDFMDDIKKLREMGNAEEDSLDELDIEDEEDEEDDYEDGDEDDEEIGEDEGEEEGDDDDDDDEVLSD